LRQEDMHNTRPQHHHPSFSLYIEVLYFDFSYFTFIFYLDCICVFDSRNGRQIYIF
jgi:hypothetical protein